MNMQEFFFKHIDSCIIGGFMGKRDLNLKVYLSDPRRYADIINAEIFDGKQMVHAKELEPTTTIATNTEHGVDIEKISDIEMHQKINENHFAIWILENQEAIDYSIPVRIFLKDALEYERQVRDLRRKNTLTGTIFTNTGEFLYKIKKTDKIHPVCTLIIYWGNEPWDGPHSLHDFIDFSYDNPTDVTRLKQLIPEYPLHIIDLSQRKNFNTYQTELKTLFELYIRREEKTEFIDYIQTHDECKHLDDETYHMLGIMTNTDELLNYLPENEMEETNMCKAIQDLIEDSKEEGIATQLTSSITHLMKKFNCTLEEACDMIGKSVDDYYKAKKLCE